MSLKALALDREELTVLNSSVALHECTPLLSAHNLTSLIPQQSAPKHFGSHVILTDPRTQHFSLLSLPLPARVHLPCTNQVSLQGSPGPSVLIIIATTSPNHQEAELLTPERGKPRQALVEHQRRHNGAGRQRKFSSRQRFSLPFSFFWDKTNKQHTLSLRQSVTMYTLLLYRLGSPGIQRSTCHGLSGTRIKIHATTPS